MSNNLICFGDVVKLSAKSAFADATGDNDATNFLGFLEQKKEMLLVVAPVKDELKDKFLEAEFVISAVRGEKAPLPGTPLNYKQPFVLKTSDGSGYSLNNKTPGASEVVSLREASIKGEMYVAVEKEGFGAETHVHDSDTNVELHVVDSNRIRKNYDNVALRHYAKAKSDAPGGFVTCAAKKGTVLSFKIVKVADKTETRAFIKDPVMRRASQLLLLQDPKADETSEASVLESPSRAGSIVTTGPLVATSAPASPTAAAAATADRKFETPETADVDETPVAAKAVETMSAAGAMGVDAAALAAQLQTVAAAHETTPTTTTAAVEVPATETPVPAAVPAVVTVARPAVSEQLHSALATIELSAAFVSSHADGVDGSVPVHDKLATPTHHTPTTTTTTAMPTTTTTAKSTAATASTVEHSELDDTLTGLPSVPEEHLETACAGKCAIM